MHGQYHRTRLQRTTLTCGHALAVAAALWILSGHGRSALGYDPADPLRRQLLGLCSVVYWARLAATTHVLIQRSMDWPEVAVVLPWVAAIQLTLTIAGGSNRAPVGLPEVAGLALYVAGSVLNTGSEWSRLRWKRRHPGRLYTQGLFRLSRHINYFGDSVLFTGFAIVTGVWWTLAIPLVMTAGFLFQHIPANENHLAEKYGQEFQAWTLRTRRFVPFLF